jgi:hypothetical protein
VYFVVGVFVRFVRHFSEVNIERSANRYLALFGSVSLQGPKHKEYLGNM